MFTYRCITIEEACASEVINERLCTLKRLKYTAFHLISKIKNSLQHPIRTINPASAWSCSGKLSKVQAYVKINALEIVPVFLFFTATELCENGGFFFCS